MAIKAIFAGINKHLDSSIPELSGARRDATALWALFTDTIEGLSARLLVTDITYIRTYEAGGCYGSVLAPDRRLGYALDDDQRFGFTGAVGCGLETQTGTRCHGAFRSG